MAETVTTPVYELPETPTYHEAIPKLTQDDPVDADEVVNPLIQKILENIHAVKTELDNADATGAIPITRITAEMPDESGESSAQPVLDESTGTIKTLLLPDEIGSDKESIESFAGFRVVDGAIQSTSTKIIGVQVDGSNDSVVIKATQIRIGGGNGIGDVLYLPGIEMDMQTGTTIIRGSCNENDGPCVEIDDAEMRFYNASHDLLFQITADLVYGVTFYCRLNMSGNRITGVGYPEAGDDAVSHRCMMDNITDAVAALRPKVFTVTIPATNTGVTGSVSGTFPACTASETDCIVDAAPAAASWDAFYDCNFRLKSISPTGFTYTVDSNLTSPMTVYITVQDISDPVAEGGA